jgi:rhamnogalacturonyl hydrolase YesR
MERKTKTRLRDNSHNPTVTFWTRADSWAVAAVTVALLLTMATAG